MVPHPHDDGPVERRVSLSMTAAVEAVAARRHPGRSRDGAGPAELGEGGFRMNPIGVVAKDDQHLGGGVGTDAKALTQRRRGLGGESTQVTVVVHDLDGESEPATGERPEGMFRRGGRRIDRAAPPSAASFEERLVGERTQGLTEGVAACGVGKLGEQPEGPDESLVSRASRPRRRGSAHADRVVHTPPARP